MRSLARRGGCISAQIALYEGGKREEFRAANGERYNVHGGGRERGGGVAGSVAEDDRGLQLIYVPSVTRAFVRKRARHRCATPAILREAGHEFPASSVRPRRIIKESASAETSRPGVRVVDLYRRFRGRERERALDIEGRCQLPR